jgi:hypothetical protein
VKHLSGGTLQGYTTGDFLSPGSSSKIPTFDLRVMSRVFHHSATWTLLEIFSLASLQYQPWLNKQ